MSTGTTGGTIIGGGTITGGWGPSLRSIYPQMLNFVANPKPNKIAKTAIANPINPHKIQQKEAQADVFLFTSDSGAKFLYN